MRPPSTTIAAEWRMRWAVAERCEGVMRMSRYPMRPMATIKAAVLVSRKNGLTLLVVPEADCM